MAQDWTSIVAFAQQMIAQYGRTIAVQELSGVAADSNKPWRGVGGAPSVLNSVTTMGCFVPPVKDEFGRSIATDDMLDKVEEVVLIGQTTTDIEKFTTILDGGSRYRIEWGWTLKPGSTILLYAFGVCR